MDRFSVHIDAGYLLAEGGKLCLRARERSRILCQYEAVVKAIVEKARELCGLQLLRVYWYDGAVRAIPTDTHRTIAHLPNVKLRLGRIVGGEQKGVDALILRDLMTLAREKAIGTAFLLSGDEDLREAVYVAQDLGVRVVLLGIPPIVTQTNQSEALIQEADEHVVLHQPFWQPHFSSPVQPVQPVDRHPKPIDAPKAPAAESGTAEEKSRWEAVGRQFAVEWLKRSAPQDLQALWSSRPIIPKGVDRELLDNAQKEFGSLDDKDQIRQALRKAFWAQIGEAIKNSGPPRPVA